MTTQTQVDSTPALNDLWREYYTLNEQHAATEKRLRELRLFFANHYCPDRSEGTAGNIVNLSPGYQLVVDQGFNRTVDEAAFEANRRTLQRLKVSTDELLRRRPELNVKVYRSLNDEQRAAVDEFITVTPALPRLIIRPKPEAPAKKPKPSPVENKRPLKGSAVKRVEKLKAAAKKTKRK